MHLGAVRLKTHGALEVAYSLVRPALFQVSLSGSVQRIGKSRIDFERLAEHLERLIRLPLLKIHGTQGLVTPRLARADGDLLPAVRLGLLGLPEMLVGYTEVVVGKGQLGIERCGLSELALRARVLLKVQIRDAQQQMHPSVVTAHANHLLEG